MSPRRGTEARLRRLAERPLPGESEARERGWSVVAAAYAERPPASSRPRVLRPLAAAAMAAALLVVALALTPAGARMGDWIEQRFERESESGGSSFAALPRGGDVLTVARGGAWVVGADGSLQDVGAFSQAGWSPRGKFVIGVRGRRLVAVTPTGEVRWTVNRPGRVHDPAWSGGLGYRVAYLEGTTLRAVVGDGTGDRLVRRAAASVAPAWRPGARWVVSYAGAGGLIETVDVDSRRRLWARRTAEEPVALAWTRDGRRLVALFGDRLRVYDRRGRPLLSRPLQQARTLALHPDGRRAAVAAGGRNGTRVLNVPLRGSAPARSLFDGFGRVEGLAWSPDGRRLLLAWRDADQWLLLGPRRKVRALSEVSGELGAGRASPGSPAGAVRARPGPARRPRRSPRSARRPARTRRPTAPGCPRRAGRGTARSRSGSRGTPAAP